MVKINNINKLIITFLVIILSLLSVNAVNIVSYYPSNLTTFQANNQSQIITINTDINSNCNINGNSMTSSNNLNHTYNLDFGNGNSSIQNYNLNVQCNSTSYNTTTVSPTTLTNLRTYNPNITCIDPYNGNSNSTTNCGANLKGIDYTTTTSTRVCQLLFGSNYDYYSNIQANGFFNTFSFKPLNPYNTTFVAYSTIMTHSWLTFYSSSLTCKDINSQVNSTTSTSLSYSRLPTNVTIISPTHNQILNIGTTNTLINVSTNYKSNCSFINVNGINQTLNYLNSNSSGLSHTYNFTNIFSNVSTYNLSLTCNGINNNKITTKNILFELNQQVFTNNNGGSGGGSGGGSSSTTTTTTTQNNSNNISTIQAMSVTTPLNNNIKNSNSLSSKIFSNLKVTPLENKFNIKNLDYLIYSLVLILVSFLLFPKKFIKGNSKKSKSKNIKVKIIFTIFLTLSVDLVLMYVFNQI